MSIIFDIEKTSMDQPAVGRMDGHRKIPSIEMQGRRTNEGAACGRPCNQEDIYV